MTKYELDEMRREEIGGMRVVTYAFFCLVVMVAVLIKWLW